MIITMMMNRNMMMIRVYDINMIMVMGDIMYTCHHDILENVYHHILLLNIIIAVFLSLEGLINFIHLDCCTRCAQGLIEIN